jgi:hypothetical protein
VHDRGEQISIAARGQRVEEIAGYGVGAIAQARGGERGARRVGGCGLVDDGAT